MTGSGRLEGRVAIVTGASAGIGEATARALAGAGARVAVCARRHDRLERLAAGLAGHDIAVHALEVTDAGAVRAMMDEVGARWGRIDVLVNNAGRGLSATVEDTKPQEFRALLELNLMAVATATQAALPWMRKQGRGHIINVSSIVGRRGVPYRGAYSATKAALGGWTESLRVELVGTGIAVSLVYPIATATEFHEAETRRAGPGRTGPVQSAEHVARCILRCVRRPRLEVYPFWPSKLLAIANVVAPRLVDLGMRRMLR